MLLLSRGNHTLPSVTLWAFKGVKGEMNEERETGGQEGDLLLWPESWTVDLLTD